jgi:hypothetical protein
MNPMNSMRIARLRAIWLALLAATLGALALVACGTTTQVATPDANAILQQASQVNITDATFDLTFAGPISGRAVNGTGDGTFTKNPKRTQYSLTIPVTANGTTTQIKVETITDTATKTDYTQTTTNGVAGKWTKSPSTSDSLNADDLTDFTTFSNAKVIGSETLNGVAVWHIQAKPGVAPTATATAHATTGATTTATTKAGTPTKTATPTKTPTKTPTISPASATKTAVVSATQTATANATTDDIYIRKDNSYPVKVAEHVAITGAATDTVFTFTKFNSGVTITLPKV